MPCGISISTNLCGNKIAEEPGSSFVDIDSELTEVLVHAEVVDAVVATIFAIVGFEGTHACPAAEITDVLIIGVHEPMVFLYLWDMTHSQDVKVFLGERNGGL